jgi:2-polyprenyl-3-methyl-5-hydroxy-6-metoxy-1,4-benzoquinol methylase
MPTFDQYGKNYQDVVQRAIDFAGLEYEFFVKAKARIIRHLAAGFDRAAGASLLDVGCGVGTLHDHLGGTFARIAELMWCRSRRRKCGIGNSSIG